MIVLEVHDVSIRYITGDFKDIGLKEYTMKKLKGDYHVTEFWADRNISFTLEKGEMLGIIGTNGAGKSTLLKAVSGIMEPTAGYVKREGNIAALLELASGFDGDLTVRENAYLRGAMLGYTRKFMDDTYDQIIDFAELRDFQDRPFRQLSSGMKSRLAFSIASLVQPDILILDEVLSVGDGAFRKKSEEKMREIIAGGAATILVSHSVEQVRRLCTKILWLDHGRQVALSENVEEICGLYQKYLDKSVMLEDVERICLEREGSIGTIHTRTYNVQNQAGQSELQAKRESESQQRKQEENLIMESNKLAGWPSFDLLRRVSKEFRLAFFSACIIGAITHLYVFTNLIINHDSVWRLFYDNDNLASGRWFLQFLSDISTRFQLPVVIGILSIIMLALSAGLTIRILNITNPVCIVLAAGFIVTFPSVACIFSYMFTADAYFIALFLNVLAVYLIQKYRFGWLPGILLLTLGCGTYQAFICYAIGILVFDCLVRLFSQESVKSIFKRSVMYIATLLVALICYYIILKLLLAINHVTLSSYQGLNGINITNIKGFFAEIPLAYKNFAQYFLHSPYLTKLFQLIQILLCLSLLGCVLYLTAVKRLFKDGLRLGFIILAVVVLPLALNFITVLSVGAQVHALMIYAFVLLFVFAIKSAEMVMQHQIEMGNGNWKAGLTIISVLCVLMLWNNFCISNTAYLRLQVCYENSFALANRIVARIEELDGYSPELPVAVVGEASRKLYGGTVQQFSQINSLTGTNDTLLFSPEPHLRTRTFIDQYIGIHMPTPNAEQKNMLNSSETIKEMPSYPAEGSVVLVDDVIVVKLSNGAVR